METSLKLALFAWVVLVFVLACGEFMGEEGTGSSATSATSTGTVTPCPGDACALGDDCGPGFVCMQLDPFSPPACADPCIPTEAVPCPIGGVCAGWGAGYYFCADPQGSCCGGG